MKEHSQLISRAGRKVTQLRELRGKTMVGGILVPLDEAKLASGPARSPLAGRNLMALPCCKSLPAGSRSPLAWSFAPPSASVFEGWEEEEVRRASGTTYGNPLGAYLPAKRVGRRGSRLLEDDPATRLVTYGTSPDHVLIVMSTQQDWAGERNGFFRRTSPVR